MALLGSSIVGDVGLRLLLCPFGSNIVMRTACCSVGVVLPVYSTFKAIERKDQDDQQRMLLYWAAYGSFSLVEIFSDKLLSWFPLYYHTKFAFLVWLQLPSVDGAKQLYVSHLRPLFLRHQSRLDQILGFAYVEMDIDFTDSFIFILAILFLHFPKDFSLFMVYTKLISAHQTEIQYAKGMFLKMMGSVEQVARGSARPNHGSNQSARAIEGQPRSASDAESDTEE